MSSSAPYDPETFQYRPTDYWYHDAQGNPVRNLADLLRWERECEECVQQHKAKCDGLIATVEAAPERERPKLARTAREQLVVGRAMYRRAFETWQLAQHVHYQYDLIMVGIRPARMNEVLLEAIFGSNEPIEEDDEDAS
jgi:hypothetical protein